MSHVIIKITVNMCQALRIHTSMKGTFSRSGEFSTTRGVQDTVVLASLDNAIIRDFRGREGKGRLRDL